MLLVDVGYKNYLNRREIDGILDYGSSPVRKLVQSSRDRGVLMDMTKGKRTRTVIRLKSGAVAISALTSETIGHRVDAVAQDTEKESPLERQHP